jgi:hypothetical protein
VAPGGVGDTAAFTTMITANRSVTIDQPLTVGALKFDDDNSYTLDGPSEVTLQAPDTASARIVVQNIHGNGAHMIATPLEVASDLTIDQQSAGQFTIAGPLDNSAGHPITKSGTGTLMFNGPQMHGVGASLTVSAGTVNINTNAGSNAARHLTVHANSTTNFGDSQHLAALNIGAGATAAITSGGPKNLVTNSLNIAGGDTPTGRLDLTDNAAIVDYPAEGSNPEATIRAQIITGRGGSGLGKTWNGQGITSSTAAAAAVNSMSVGYAVNGQLPLGAYGEFRGQTVDGTSILLAYTRTADANLDGVVDNDDVTIIGANYAPGFAKPRWDFGDFDYNGFVDNDDVTLLGVYYNPSAPPIPVPEASGVAAVPEPGTVVLLASGLLLPFIFRRRSRARLRLSTIDPIRGLAAFAATSRHTVARSERASN